MTDSPNPLRAPRWSGAGRYRVAIIGAGVSGLGAAIQLKEAGIPFTVLEGADEVGGTWYANTYPGLKVDSPLVQYRFEHEPLRDWKTLYPTGAQIFERLSEMVETHGLRPFIRTGTTIREMSWGGERWTLTAEDGLVVEAELVLCATGWLREPRYPDIPGLDTFEGPVMHSARWDHSVELDGKRVVVIGSGSTGTQLVSALTPRVEHLVHINRTPQWLLPSADVPVNPRLSRALGRHQFLANIIKKGVLRYFSRFYGNGGIRDGWERRLFATLCRKNLESVTDLKLRKQLTPTDPPLCKRPVMSRTYYPAVQQPHVDVVVGEIDKIDATGLQTRDGRRFEVDVIALATGFHAHAYMRPMKVHGENGIEIDEVWDPEPFAYNSVAVPGFPNMFIAMGPHCPLVHVGPHLSNVLVSQYLIKAVEYLRSTNAAGVAPTEAATKAWLDEVREGMAPTIWSQCDSYYTGASGTAILYPFPRTRWEETFASFAAQDYVTIPAPVTAAAGSHDTEGEGRSR